MNEESKLPRELWLKALGFPHDPFSPEAIRAEADDLMINEGAFVQFAYYDSILGNFKSPGPRFVFGKRGGGKTALRLQLCKAFDDSLRLDTDRILAVEYNDFDPVLERADHKISEVRPRYHVEEIVSLIMQRLFYLMVQEDQLITLDKLDESNKRLFVWYAQNFGVLHEWQYEHFAGKLEGPEHFLTSDKVLKMGKGMLQLAADVASPIAGRVVSLFNEMINIERPIAKIDPQKVPLTDLLDGIIRICCSLGLDAIYILVDDVDEPQYYGEQEDFEPAFELIRTLAASPKLLGIPSLIFKIFLPLEIRDRCLTSLRLDKFSEHVISWGWHDLNQTLRRRLRTASEDGSETLKSLCDSELAKDIDDWVVDFAKEKGNPRALLYVGNELLVEHFRELRNVDQKVIRATWERARQRAEEVL